MDLFKSVHHGSEHLIKRSEITHGSLFLQPLLQALPVEILHNDIARAVFHEKVIDIHDARNITEARDRLRLFEKAAAPLFDDFIVGFRNAVHSERGRAVARGGA